MQVEATGKTMTQAQFRVGEVVRHRLHDYRGVVFDMDAAHNGDQQKPAGAEAGTANQPWYHVLIDDADHADYVAEQHLEAMVGTDSDIRHPDLSDHFRDFADGRYRPRADFN